MRTRVGYCGGSSENPTYHNLVDHTETLQLDYNPALLSYEDLVFHFYAEHRPLSPAYSRQYMSAIFCDTEDELATAEEVRAKQENRYGGKLYTEIQLAKPFYRAEDYHQKYSLQRSKEVTGELLSLYPNFNAFTDAPAAMRLNAYMGRHLTKKQFQEERHLFGLSEQAMRILDKSIR